jgi:hypothetical protein
MTGGIRQPGSPNAVLVRRLPGSEAPCVGHWIRGDGLGDDPGRLGSVRLRDEVLRPSPARRLPSEVGGNGNAPHDPVPQGARYPPGAGYPRAYRLLSRRRRPCATQGAGDGVVSLGQANEDGVVRNGRGPRPRARVAGEQDAVHGACPWPGRWPSRAAHVSSSWPLLRSTARSYGSRRKGWPVAPTRGPYKAW